MSKVGKVAPQPKPHPKYKSWNTSHYNWIDMEQQLYDNPVPCFTQPPPDDDDIVDDEDEDEEEGEDRDEEEDDGEDSVDFDASVDSDEE